MVARAATDAQPAPAPASTSASNDDTRRDDALRDALVVRELVAAVVRRPGVDRRQTSRRCRMVDADRRRAEPADGWFNVNGRRFRRDA
jgi:hypothetical protein